MKVANDHHDQTAADRVRRRRSLAIALMLGLMVLAFYVATFVRFGSTIAEKAL